MTDIGRDDPAPRPIVLVHGAWHGAWCWATLQAELDRRGVASWAIDLPGHGASTAPLTDLAGDAAHLSATLDALALHDVVLVGHSYGGAVTTAAAGERPDLAHLVYVAAFALDAGESVMSVVTGDPRDVALAAAMLPRDDGTSVLDPDLAVPALYGQCPPAAIAAAVPRLGPQPMSTFVQAVSGSPRDTLPSTYVVCSRDEAVHPDHQAAMGARCTHQVTIDTDHSPFVSTPDVLADVLTAIAVDRELS